MTNEGVYMHSDLILKRDQSMYLFSFLIDKESELREVSQFCKWFMGNH